MDFPPKKLHVMRESAGVIVVRDTDTWEPVFSLPERESDISSVSWSPDGHMIASGHQDGTISVWDVETRTEYRRMASHNGRVTQVSWSGDGYHIASASADGTIRLWDADTGHPLQEFAGRRDAIHSTTWSSDGVRIVWPRSPDRVEVEISESRYYDGELPPNMIARFPTERQIHEHESKFLEVGWIAVGIIAVGWVCLCGVLLTT